jgi:hypothetical protein
MTRTVALLACGRTSRRQGGAAPHLWQLVAQLICMNLNRDVLAEAGRDEELVRTYRELMARLAKR